MRHYYTFQRGNGKRREFGPHANEREAMEAFQHLYGYWPDAPVLVRPHIEGNDT